MDSWQAFFAAGITVRRVPADNGSCYRSRLWRDPLAAAGIAHKRTRPFRPQTNGKVERYHRTLLDEWAYARPCTRESERRAALAPWLHMYNHHRGHTALGGLPPRQPRHQPVRTAHLAPAASAPPHEPTPPTT
ncbi:hypothetical protein Acsp04_50900 [Actinomadura sp. NBRC 104425]|nr:hypothetical protein Acsp04_50900 [Actinomadura sp. NBRC 104425]